MTRAAPLYYLLMTIVAQAFALGAALFISRNTDLSAPLEGIIVFQAVLAFTLARSLKLSFPWQLLNLALPPAAVAFLTIGVPTWLLAVGVVLSLIIYLPTFWTHVPFYPTSRLMYEEVLKRLPTEREFTFIDLGSGYGSMIGYLAKERPQGRFFGAEIAPLPYLVSRIRFLGATNGPKILFKSFWKIDLGAFDFIYAFLAPGPMPALWGKVTSENRAHQVFMTNTFRVDAPADETVEVRDTRHCVLYLHKLPRK